MRINQIILPKIILLSWYFKNEEVFQLLYLYPRVFSFNTMSIPVHLYSISNQRDQALFDSFKVPH